MSDLTERLKTLEAKCSGFAWEFLSALQGHPKLPELIDKLEKIEGRLYRVEVEETFFQITAPGNPKPSSSAPSAARRDRAS